MLHADLTLLLHTHQVADGACFLVYRLHALHAGTALVIAYVLQVGPPTIMAHGIAFAIVDLCRNGTAYPR